MPEGASQSGDTCVLFMYSSRSLAFASLRATPADYATRCLATSVSISCVCALREVSGVMAFAHSIRESLHLIQVWY